MYSNNKDINKNEVEIIKRDALLVSIEMESSALEADLMEKINFIFEKKYGEFAPCVKKCKDNSLFNAMGLNEGMKVLIYIISKEIDKKFKPDPFFKEHCLKQLINEKIFSDKYKILFSQYYKFNQYKY